MNMMQNIELLLILIQQTIGNQNTDQQGVQSCMRIRCRHFLFNRTYSDFRTVCLEKAVVKQNETVDY